MGFGVAFVALGYKLGSWDAKDDMMAAHTVVEFETEEQIYDYLINQKKMAVFVYLFAPGSKPYDDFNNVFERESSKYQLAYKKRQDSQTEEDEKDDIVFMRVNCRRHLNYCINKMWSGRVQPSAELYSIGEGEQGQIEMLDFDNWHRSAQGIEGFFTKHGLIEDRFDPEELLVRG